MRPLAVRVLSGWDPEHGGRCPDSACLGADRVHFNMLTTALFGTIQHMSQDFKDCLTCILVMHHNAVASECPEHPLVRKMVRAVEQHRKISVDKLAEWSGSMLGSFHSLNAEYLPRRFTSPGSSSEGESNTASSRVVSIAPLTERCDGEVSARDRGAEREGLSTGDHGDHTDRDAPSTVCTDG